MIIQISVVAVLAIVLILCLFKSAQNWNWVQITFTALIFLTAIFAGIAASKSLKTRRAWTKQYDVNEKSLMQSKKDFNQQMYGPENAIQYSDDSLIGTNTRLRLERIGIGRVWTSGNPTVQGNQVDIQFPAGATASPAAQFAVDMMVFGFADGGATIEDQTVSVPTKFLGTFKVTATAGETVSMQPVFVTDATETATPTTTWSFFERMPGDVRDSFQQDFRDNNGLGPEDTIDLTQYRQALVTKYLPADLVGLVATDEMTPEEKSEILGAYEALIDEYAFDGRDLNEIDAWLATQTDRINDQFDPDPQQRRVTLRFTGNSEEFTVDSTGTLETDGPFNGQGEANDPQLHLDGPASFKQDDELPNVDKQYAVDGFPLGGTDRQLPLVDTNPAEVIGESFERELRDYPYLLEELGVQTEKLRESKAQVEQDIADINALVADANKQIGKRDEIIDQLQSDITRMQADLAVITDLFNQRTSEFEQKQEQIQTYYKQILELYKQSNQGDAVLETNASEVNGSLVSHKK